MANVYDRKWTKQEFLERVGRAEQVAGVRLVEAAEGTARGGRLLNVWTGSGLCFDVLADRALDVSACRYKGVPLAWSSSTGDVHPAHYEPEGLGWLRSFPGGLLATCGLDHFGPPSSDEDGDVGLHGRASNTPARFVGHRAHWAGDEYEIEITGEARQTRVFGENLVLRRRISTRMGSSAIRVEDTVTNEGFAPQAHMILYHCNLGFPLVSEEARLVLESEETIARDADAEAGLEEWDRFQPPTAGYSEQVFRHRVATDGEGRSRVELQNPALGLTLRLTYNLPYLIHWKMMGQGLYVCGVEPANCGVMHGRGAARESGELPLLEPGESRGYEVKLEVIE